MAEPGVHPHPNVLEGHGALVVAPSHLAQAAAHPNDARPLETSRSGEKAPAEERDPVGAPIGAATGSRSSAGAVGAPIGAALPLVQAEPEFGEKIGDGGVHVAEPAPVVIK